MSDPVNGYVAVLSYCDRSGILVTFGPWPTEDDAQAAVEWLKRMPTQDGIFEIFPLCAGPNTAAVTR